MLPVFIFNKMNISILCLFLSDKEQGYCLDKLIANILLILKWQSELATKYISEAIYMLWKWVYMLKPSKTKPLGTSPGQYCCSVSIFRECLMWFTTAEPHLLKKERKHTPTATACLLQRDGREMYLDFVVDHTVPCYPRNLFQSVALFCPTLVNKDSQQSPLSVLGKVRVTERYQPIPDGFQNVGLGERNAEKNIDFLCGIW